MEGPTTLLDYAKAKGKMKALRRGGCAVNHLFFFFKMTS